MLTSNVLAAYIGTVSYHGNIYPTMHDFNLLYRMFGEAIKKKATKLDIVQTSADPPPQAVMDAKSLDAQTWFICFEACRSIQNKETVI